MIRIMEFSACQKAASSGRGGNNGIRKIVRFGWVQIKKEMELMKIGQKNGEKFRLNVDKRDNNRKEGTTIYLRGHRLSVEKNTEGGL